MCIAILNNGNQVSRESFKESLLNNPDGFGMAYILEGQLMTYKSLSKNFNKLYNKYLSVFKETKSPIVLHFRIGTSGKNDLLNCHPFYVNKGLIFCHNGIIKGLGSTKLNESDTREFNRTYLSGFTTFDLFNNEALKGLIEAYIGHSKFIFLDQSGNFKIFNEGLGHWDNNNNWFSNYSYVPYSPPAKKDKGKFVEIDWDEYEYSKGEDLNSSLNRCDGCLEYGLLEYSQEFKAPLCKDCVEFLTNENKF